MGILSLAKRREGTCFYFRPKEDITAYELACIYQNLRTNVVNNEEIYFSDEQLKITPANIMRHFADK